MRILKKVSFQGYDISIGDFGEIVICGTTESGDPEFLKFKSITDLVMFHLVLKKAQDTWVSWVEDINKQALEVASGRGGGSS